ncbi:MAG: hypothetical protein WD076_11050 [Parvularculaceae bacterium]
MSISKKLSASSIGVCILAAAVIGASGLAYAKPDKPDNAAVTGSGTGCLVRDANGAYHYDAACKWHTVIKRDKDGNLIQFFYQDQGTLPESAPHPSSAIRVTHPWPGCPASEIDEVTTPSGEYRSDCRYKK